MMSTPTPAHSVLAINEMGGYYQEGKPFGIVKKNEAALIYERLKKKKEEAGAGGEASPSERSRVQLPCNKVCGIEVPNQLRLVYLFC
jgi:hypothetical protein